MKIAQLETLFQSNPQSKDLLQEGNKIMGCEYFMTLESLKSFLNTKRGSLSEQPLD